jgi:hypothetical protein
VLLMVGAEAAVVRTSVANLSPAGQRNRAGLLYLLKATYAAASP